MVPSMPLFKDDSDEEAGNSQYPTASEDANQKIIDKTPRGKQGH